jgi:hypothetical protein
MERVETVDQEEAMSTFMLTYQPDKELYIMTKTEAINTASRAL